MKNHILHINPAFEHLRSFIESVPKRFEKEGETIYTGRNLIKVFEYQGLRINIKRYHTPYFINSLIYSYFRPSKGWRAYTYPQRLLQAGVSTPEPIAYIEERCCGLIGLSYFISI
ncbi:MAG: tyrosine protein kinase, partial [Bacteroidales bacterium]|nr:tyrosine protein kinase [Bacteroidales bacterium]